MVGQQNREYAVVPTACSMQERQRRVEVNVLAQLAVEQLGLLGLRELAGQPLHLLAQLGDLRAGMERVGEPAGDVPHGRQHGAGALLDRREDLDDSALNRVQRARGWPAEVCR